MTKRTKRSTKTLRNTAVASEASFTSDSGMWIPPAFADDEERYAAIASTSTRRSETKDSPIKTFPNLNNFSSPFKKSGGGAFMDTREAVHLCVQAYWAFPLLRNVVEVMSELSNSRIYLKGGNKKTRDFIIAWFNKINLWQLKEQFFREWFRSANCFIYRFDGAIREKELSKMTQVYGSRVKKEIPVKYILLDPESITVSGNISFNKPVYHKVLSSFELDRIKNPKTPEDIAIVQGMDPEVVKKIREGITKSLELSPEQLSALLYKAQPYEPMGVPMAYGVLNDIEAKLELKRIDLSIARTTDRALLLLTVGESPTEHNKGANINHNTIAALQQMFANESISRTLIADYTVKGDWLIPDVDKILGAKKYEQIDKDINTGLNAIIFNSDEKFANTSIKIQIFIERLKEARNAFLQNFLTPEINRVCKAIGAKNTPTAIFEDLSLKDEIQYMKLVLSMAQLGFLTPAELFEAAESGKIPTQEESIEAQREFKKLREEGLYLPIVGGATQVQKEQLDIQQQQVDNQLELGKEANVVKKQQMKMKPPGQKGRPTGSKGPKAASKPKPMGAKAALGYSISKIKEIIPLVSEVHTNVEKSLKKKHKIRKLNEAQAKIATLLVESIISNEPQDKWTESVESYLTEPKEISEAAQAEIDELRIKHDITGYEAAILRHAVTEAPTDEEEFN